MMAITSTAGNKDNLAWTVAPKATYTKQMGKIFRLLQQNDLVKADKAMVKLEEDSKKVYEKQAAKNQQAISCIDALYPLWDVALCLKDCKSEDDSSAKLWSTYEHLKKIIDHGERLQETDAFLAMPGIATSLAEIREHLEQALIAQTRAMNSEEAYVRLLGTITDGPHHAALVNEIETLAYNLVLKRGEIKGYIYYDGENGDEICTPYYNQTNEGAPIVKVKEIRDLGTNSDIYWGDSDCCIKVSNLNERFMIEGNLSSFYDYRNNMPYGGKSIAIFTESFAPIDVYLPEFGIDRLKRRHVYEIVFEDPHDYTHIRTAAEAAYVKAMTTGNNQILLDTHETRGALRAILEEYGDWDYSIEFSSDWGICRVGKFYYLSNLTHNGDYRIEFYYDPDGDGHYGLCIGHELYHIGNCVTEWMRKPSNQSIPESFRKGYAIKFW